jgi:hypothetical protein
MKEGFCFVIPNKISELLANDSFPFWNNLETFKLFHFDFEFPPEEMVEVKNKDGTPHKMAKHSVQIWWTDGEEESLPPGTKYSENWSDHGVEIDGTWHRGGWFPSYVPAYLFAGKKEGDTVEFEYDNIKFKVVLRQLAYRYKRFGPFEDAFNYATKGAFIN